MRYQADYLKAVQAAEAVLREYGHALMPLRLDLLLGQLSNEIALMPYSRFMALHHMSEEEVFRWLDSELGACLCMPSCRLYVILYNDRKPPAVSRFTIAHELGHIFLKHHEKAGSDVLSRTFVPAQQYEEFEKEANAFARNLLAPASLANLVLKRSRGTPVQGICRAFFISPAAAKVRLDYIQRDLSCLTAEMLSFFTRFRAVPQAWVCPECRTPLLPDTAFCPMCGSSRRAWGYAYEPLPADGPEKAAFCPRCGNARLPEGANYCPVCGLPLRNACALGHPNPSGARFCVICGGKTLFQGFQLLPGEAAGPAEYESGIPYDESTFRAAVCPGCRYQKHLKDAAFCIMCGADLYNRCIPDHADQETHANPPFARFCRQCGRPAAGAGFLPAFTELLAGPKAR